MAPMAGLAGSGGTACMAPYRTESGGVVADLLSGTRCSHVRTFRRKTAANATVLAQVLAARS